jgi:ATP-binding cassette subfamily A (ABC1) protein 3
MTTLKLCIKMQINVNQAKSLCDFISAIHPISTKNKTFSLYQQQYRAMFWKRVLHTGRNWLVTLTQLLVPLFFTVLTLIILRTLPQPEDSPPLTMSTSHFRNNYILYSDGIGSSKMIEDLGHIYANQFEYSSSIPIHVNLSESQSLDTYLVSIGERGIATYNAQYMLALELKNQSGRLKTMGFFNAQSYHTAPMTLSAVDNMWLKYYMNQSYSIQTTNHPFPRTTENKINDQLTQGFEGFVIATNVVFGMAFLASSFVLFLIKERTIKAKHCQFVSGVESWTFWAATFSWDLINYMLPCFLLILAFAAFGVGAYIDDERFLYIMLLFLLYGWALLPFMYLLSFLFNIPASGFVWLSMLNIFSGKCPLHIVILFILQHFF